MHSFPIVTIDTPCDVFPSLGEIPQSPTQLRLRGTLDKLRDKKIIAVVGSRNCSGYGKSICKTLIEGLRGYPVVIVSGIALGIDAIAHKSALEAGLTTIAFPGSGLEWKCFYPALHKGLAEEILLHNGALISEYDDHQRAALWTFPKRNRLMAGVADIVIVIEAEEKSGTLITARLATEYNKTVGAVPGPIGSPSSKGTNWLLKLGAVPITEAGDIIRELGLIEHAPPSDTASTILLSEQEQRILSILSTPKSRDQIVETLSLSAVEVTIILSTLEIKGMIRETYGMIVRIA